MYIYTAWVGLNRVFSAVASTRLDRTEASFEEDLVTNMTYADQMHEARGTWWILPTISGTNAWRNPHLYKLYVKEPPTPKNGRK